jgi:hypothetical protein
MDSRAVIDVIRQHQAKFRKRCKSRVGVEINEDMRVSLAIAEEYDSLLAEIEALTAGAAREKADEPVKAVAE